LSDWVEEQYGFAPEFEQRGFSDDPISDSLNGRRHHSGNGRSCAPDDYGWIEGDGVGHGSGYGDFLLTLGDGVGCGIGSGQTNYGNLQGSGFGDSR